MLLAGHIRPQLRAISTQDPVPVQVQSGANRAASNMKGKLDQS
jgi:hypothetical protein